MFTKIIIPTYLYCKIFVQFSDDSYVYVPLTPQIEEMFGLTTVAVETEETHDSEAIDDSIESHNNAGCSANQDEGILYFIVNLYIFPLAV